MPSTCGSSGRVTARLFLRFRSGSPEEEAAFVDLAKASRRAFASGDSELNLYAEKYKHARCFTENELQQAAKFVLEISRDKLLWNVLSENALAAAENFKRQNADRFVDRYLL